MAEAKPHFDRFNGWIFKWITNDRYKLKQSTGEEEESLNLQWKNSRFMAIRSLFRISNNWVCFRVFEKDDWVRKRGER